MKTNRTLIPICLLGVALLQALNSGAQTVTRIAAKNTHSLFLKSDGSLWVMGQNNFGQSGDGTINNTNRPEQIIASNVTAIAAGNLHSLFLKNNGSLWAMGYNGAGELGDGTLNTTNRPELIVATNVTAIAAGQLHSLFLKSDGSLWGMGANYYGQLGAGPSGGAVFTNQPELIVSSNVTAIAAGYVHSLFLKNDGSLWVMGGNSYGQLGDGSPNDTNRPVQIVATNVTAIVAGGFFSLFLKKDGSLWAMGENIYGELGDGTGANGANNTTNKPEQIVASNVTAIAAGYIHSLFLKNDGSLWAMGDNTYGELGDGTYGISPYFATNRPEMILSNNVTAIAGGYFHTLLLKSDGSLWAIGFNQYGQLGDGTVNQTNRPELIVSAPPSYIISAQLLSGGNVQLSFAGIAGTNYALDRSFSLSPPNWVPQVTNPAGAGRVLLFTNTPNAVTNNFWRIRSVP